MIRMTEEECLDAIAKGEDAYSLLKAAMPQAERRFRQIDRALIAFLADVRRHFPDAEYYTASGGFNLLLGKSHTLQGRSQQQLDALGGNAKISDGDY
jgi:hypothetical protein